MTNCSNSCSSGRGSSSSSSGCTQIVFPLVASSARNTIYSLRCTPSSWSQHADRHQYYKRAINICLSSFSIETYGATSSRYHFLEASDLQMNYLITSARGLSKKSRFLANFVLRKTTKRHLFQRSQNAMYLRPTGGEAGGNRLILADVHFFCFSKNKSRVPNSSGVIKGSPSITSFSNEYSQIICLPGSMEDLAALR